ncbi:hypothetical protein PSTG_06515 [Puccinia striiformis f. sp. tritici PST-78]|uniref:Importin N-terminal domain-containing protein n=1 Tax=Puccinia striiformis f. sp. tritici PST-78 TaxID=1165861 RepID=A0A0L0VM98_9BASI|nr:hypothetical protein PSTG_06515 [Puccinia striiformis f. sp. tritici PST-78]
MDVSRVLELLNVLYPSPNTPAHALPTQNQQTEAQKALYDLMAEPSAWSLASEILDSLGTHEWAQNTNARFIAAHTLAVKISRDWTSFPADQSLTLKDRLLQWLQQSVIRTTASIPGEKIVLRKLSVAISVLSFKLVPEPSRCWDNWLLEVISRLASGPTVTSSLLDVLTVIAEEAERADMLGARRVQYDQSIQDGSGLVIRTLSDALVSESYTIRLAALTCSQAWLCSSHLNIDGPITLWPILLNLLFSSKYLLAYLNPDKTADMADEEEDIVQKSADCIEELVSGSRGGASIGAGFVTKARAEVLLDWFGGDLLGSIIEHSVASGEVPDAILSIFKLFTSLSEHSIAGIAASLSSTRSLKIVRHLLRLSTYPGYGGIDENISTLILPIWTLLQEELNDLGYLGNPPEESDFDPPPSLIQENYPELRSLSTELFKTLAQGLKLKSTWPKQHFIADNWTKDMAASFKSHTRADLAECLLACYYVCRDELLLDLVMETKSLLSSPQGPDDCYEDLEACLFCIRAIQDGIPSEENTALPLVFSSEILGRIPIGDTPPLLRLRGTCLTLIASFSEWLKHRPSNLLCSLNLVAPSLTSPDPETISLAANALRRLCHEGRKVLVNEIAALAELIRSTEGKIMPDEYNKVLQAVASVLQALPAKDLVQPILSLMEPVLTRLNHALRQHSQAPDPDNRMVIITQLQQLKACNQGLSEPDEELILLDIDDDSNPEREKMAQLAQLEPIRNLQHTLSQLISNALVQSLGDVDMAVTLSELARSCTSSSIPTAISLDPFILLTTCISNISRDRTNLAIWFSLSTSLVSATCRLKGQDFPQDQWNTLVGCVKESVKVTASVLNSDAQMIQEPDLVQTFLQLCSAIIERYGQMFVALKDELQIILTIAIAGLKVEERVALQAALDILRVFAQQTQKASPPAQADLFLELLTIHGQQVLNHIVLGISGKLPRSSLPSLSETLHCFVIKLPHLSQMWLTQLMQTPGYPNEKLTEEKKVRFLKNICAARTLKKARDVCTDFAIVSRGLEGTAYGASQMSLSFAD